MHFVGQADRVLLDDRLSSVSEQSPEVGRSPSFELAGPRNRIFFDPPSSAAASSPVVGCARASTT